MAQLAIDYGTDHVTLLEFDGSGKRLRVLKVAQVPVAATATEGDDDEPSSDDVLAEAIAEVIDGQRFASDPSGMAHASSHSLFREFTLPFTNAEQIEKVVRFESESHIPLDIDDVVMQHLVLRKTRDKSHILAAAVKKDDLLDEFDVLEESNVDPMFVDMDVFALLHALVGSGVTGDHERMLVVHGQDRSTSLLFIVDGQLFAVRSLRMGAHGIPKTGEGSRGGIDDEIAEARAADYLGRFEREVKRTLTTLPGLGDLGAVLMLGSGCDIPGFGTTLARLFPSAQVERLDLLSRVEHKLSDEEAKRFGPELGAALGVAYKLAGLDLTHTDFRRDECAYTRKFDQVKSPLIVLSFVLFLIVALMGIDTYYQLKKVRQEYQFLLTDAREQLNLLMGDNAEARKVWDDVEFGPRQAQAIASAFDKRHNDLSMQLGRSSLIPDQPSALAVWVELSQLLLANQQKLGRLMLRKIDIDVSGRTPILRITGRMLDPIRYQDLIDLLAADPLFANVRPGDTTPDATGEFHEFGETTADIDLDELLRRKET